MCESRDMTQNKWKFFLKSSEITIHKTYLSKNGCTKISQTLKVNFLSHFRYSLTILKNLDVWESVYDPKHKRCFLKVLKSQVIKLSHLKTEELKFYKLCEFICY